MLTVTLFGTRHGVEEIREHGALVEVAPLCGNFLTVSHKDETGRYVAVTSGPECPDCLTVLADREPTFGPY